MITANRVTLQSQVKETPQFNPANMIDDGHDS